MQYNVIPETISKFSTCTSSYNELIFILLLDRLCKLLLNYCQIIIIIITVVI